jgi:hypothetical protein
MNAQPKSADDIVGWDVEWLACDADDHVGLFITAGGGYAPGEFLRDTDAHEAAIDAILALPASTTARFAPELRPGVVNQWRLVAERGLFAFDSDASGGPYRLEAAPETPVLATELPASVANVLRDLQYGNLHFATLTGISSESLLRPPFEERRFTYVVWFRHRSAPSYAPNHERSFTFVVVTYTYERAEEWGDELVSRYLARHPELELTRSGVTIAHARTDYHLPSVTYGQEVSDDHIGW